MLYQVCTHHRCGTVLIRNAFRKFSEKEDLVFFKGKAGDLPTNANIHQSAHSTKEEIFTNREVKGIHLFRNPIAMLSSHIKYHEKSESPLEASNKLLINGVLYKDYLASLDSFDDKAIFEIDHIFGRTLRAMIAWDYEDERYLNLDLNDFKSDKINETCHKIGQHFELTPESTESLISSFNAANNIVAVKKKHMTSESGEKISFNENTIDYLHSKFPSLARFMEERFD